MEPECKAIFSKIEKTLVRLEKAQARMDTNLEGLRGDIADLRGDLRRIAEALLAPVERKVLSNTSRGPASRAPMAAKSKR